MKNLNDYREDIYKCSKCGLCQSVCPIYEATKNEYSVSRGKFILLNGIMQNELELNNSIINNLNSCLNCNACKEFCPSDINAREIFACAKNEYNKQKNTLKLINSVKSFELKLACIKILIFLYKLLFLDKLTNMLFNKSRNKNKIEKYFSLFNYLITEKLNYRKSNKTTASKGKILFFEGCFNKYINPSSKNASINLLEDLGYEVVQKKTHCCGLHSYYSGYFDDFQKNAKLNLKKFPDDIDYIVSDCDSCISTLKLYDDVLNNETKISSKLTTVSKLLIENDFELHLKKNIQIAYHKPCNSDYDPFSLFKNIKNAECIIKSNNCCGFSNIFNLKHKKISEDISKKTTKEIIKKNPEIVITTCSSCAMGIKTGLLLNNSDIDVLSLPEFLDSQK